MNNHERYQKTFSKLQTTKEITSENIWQHKKGKLRFSKLTLACAALFILMGFGSGLTYAFTDGETFNPIRAVKVMIDGKELKGNIYRQDDGSLRVEMNN